MDREPDFVITADVYDVECGVFSTAEALGDWLDERDLGSDEVRDVSTNACARWVTAVKVCHECLHLGFFVLDVKGVEVTPENHEALAYLQDHLASQILSHYGRGDA